MQAIEASGRAELLVEELRRRWTGLRWGPVVLDRIALTSDPHEWPPVIQLDFQVGDDQRTWEDPWDIDILRDEPLEAASSFWLGVVHAHMCEHGYL